jgi:hypothetical protein
MFAILRIDHRRLDRGVRSATVARLSHDRTGLGAGDERLRRLQHRILWPLATGQWRKKEPPSMRNNECALGSVHQPSAGWSPRDWRWSAGIQI